MCGEFGLCFRDHCNIDMKSAGFVLEKVGSNSVILMLISILICIKGVQPDRIDVFHWQGYGIRYSHCWLIFKFGDRSFGR